MSSVTKRKRSGRHEATFPLFRLPPEIQATIIELACRLRPLPGNDHHDQRVGRVPPVVLFKESRKAKPKRLVTDLDMPTTLALALTSRAAYNHVVRILYSHVRIERPTALHALEKTLASRPRLGRLIKSLHLGPSEGEGEDSTRIRWVVNAEDPRMLGNPVPHVTATLSWLKEEHLIPRWCGELEWPLRVMHLPSDCRGIAISDALAVAQRAADVDLCREPYSRSGALIGSVSTVSPVETARGESR